MKSNLNIVKGGKGDNKNVTDFDKKEMEMGMRVEMEHTNDPKIASEIARDHLSEDPHYYTKLKKSGLADELNKITKSFETKNYLNQRLWVNGKLKTGIRHRLLIIANDFFKNLAIGWVGIKDVILTGSLANYNWSEYSDVDLHILLDFDDIHENKEFVKDYVDAKKNIWNGRHKIKIYGFEIEVYLQDYKEEHVSNGIYSLLNDKWLKEPDKELKEIDKTSIQEKASYLMNFIDSLSANAKYENKDFLINKIEKLRSKLRNYRRAGLERGGEYSTENLVFKTLRRNGYLEKLKNLETSIYDRAMSLKERFSAHQSDVEIFL